MTGMIGGVVPRRAIQLWEIETLAEPIGLREDHSKKRRFVKARTKEHAIKSFKNRWISYEDMPCDAKLINEPVTNKLRREGLVR